jgi:hypothetical protein
MVGLLPSSLGISSDRFEACTRGREFGADEFARHLSRTLSIAPIHTILYMPLA